MEFIKEYTCSIITVSILSILLENILPADKSKKHIHVLIGLLVMLVIMKPLTKLPHYSENFTFPNLYLNDAVLILPETENYLVQTFQRNLAASITQDIYNTHHQVIECQVTADTNEQGEMIGVKRVVIRPYTPEVAAYITEKYGLKKGCIINET